MRANRGTRLERQWREITMKLTIIGGSGLIGSKLVRMLRDLGHQAVPASPDSGVNTITGEGLADALEGAEVVVDVSNLVSPDDAAVLAFFETSTRNLLAAEAAAGVRHHVALSVVGTERLAQSGYFRAKLAQERLIKEASIPYSIVHATQFFEYVQGIANAASDGHIVRLPPVLIQPMAAEDVATAVSRVAVGPPVNGTIEVAGPEQFRLDEFIRRGLSARHDPRQVIGDPRARYAGAEVDDRTLMPGDGARLAPTRFEAWLSRPTAGQHAALSSSSERPPAGTAMAAMADAATSIGPRQVRQS
jgi:uncharacterized protein YbjT (DUF2867 family)